MPRLHRRYPSERRPVHVSCEPPEERRERFPAGGGKEEERFKDGKTEQLQACSVMIS